MKEEKDKIGNIPGDLVQQTAKSSEPQQEGPQSTANSEALPNPRAKYNKFAIMGILLTLTAWIALSFNGKVALILSIASFISACLGLKASTRSYRTTSITAIVASAVLMVVLSAFLIVIYIGLESL